MDGEGGGVQPKRIYLVSEPGACRTPAGGELLLYQDSVTI